MRERLGGAVSVSVRAFLAVALEDATAAEAGAVMDQLEETVPGVRWTRRTGLHLTIAFFEDLSADQVPDVLDAGRAAAGSVAPFDLRLGGLGGFPTTDRPRVIWLGVRSGADELSALSDACAVGLRARDVVFDDRPFRAHCTLGRPRFPWLGAGPWREAVEDRGNVALTAMFVSRLTLFESRGGYHVLGRCPLAGRSD